MNKFRFIDLFAGLGGFHVALASIGGRCVFASEIDDVLRDIYETNFTIRPAGDIREVEISEIPAHDVLCAGFPCQPFSKAGEQLGFECTKQGDLFSYVVAILEKRRPAYFILENVPNILRHDGGMTYQLIKEQLEELEYDVKQATLSPHQFGIPQIRERAYIVGSLRCLDSFRWPEASKKRMSFVSKLDKNPKDARGLTGQVVSCLNVWNRFLRSAPSRVEIPSFPLWSMEWGATYPYEETTPFALGPARLGRYDGAHGIPLAAFRKEERMAGLPSYAKTQEARFPSWKVAFIRQNREFYAANQRWIDDWLPNILAFPPSLQKLEWNVKGGDRNIWEYVIQFRASGVRVKRFTHAPSLVAMTTSQVPIIGKERRYMTARECARLQSLESLTTLPKAAGRTFKALGNAVNSEVAKAVATALLSTRASGPRKRSTPVRLQAMGAGRL